MIKILIIILLAIYFIAYIVSMAELIGGWYLTKKYQGIKWDITFEIIMPAIIPFTAFLDALINYDNAEELYKDCKPNKYNVKESLLAFYKHKKLTIEQYYNKERLKNIFNKNGE